MEHVLETSLKLSRSIEEVFAFFGEAQNLERITPPELRFRIMTPLPILMQPGALIDYQLRLFGVPFVWTTKITVWEPPFRFVDEQLRGPYKLWVHTHSFERDAEGTCIRDHVRYELPLSPLSDLAHPLITRQLRRIFAHREAAVREALS